MQIDIAAADAQARHPELVTCLLEDMEKKFRRAKLPMPDVSGFTWGYTWCAQIGPGAARPPHNLSVSLSCDHGRKRSIASLTGDGTRTTPAAQVPPEVYNAMCGARTKVSTANTPHVAQLTAIGQTGIRTELVLDGYTKRGKAHIRAQTLGEDKGSLKSLYQVEGNTLVWSGGLHRKAAERLAATAPGGTFRYRNIPLIRLTDAEIIALVQGTTFKATL